MKKPEKQKLKKYRENDEETGLGGYGSTNNPTPSNGSKNIPLIIFLSVVAALAIAIGLTLIF